MRIGIFNALMLLVSLMAGAQTSPIFNQKMTDYFTYDPSRTGFSGGSAVFTHQQLSTGLQNAPQTDFFGAHTRLGFDQFGLGGSLYYQESGIIRTYRITASGAYHMKINDQYGLSFGLAPEITRGELNFQDLFVIDMNDPVILNYGNKTDFDVSSGIGLHHDRFDAGIVMNRMMSITQGLSSNRAFQGSYSVYVQGKVPVRSNFDVIEPMLFLNRFQDGTSQIDVGGFYNYENLLFLGAMYRTKSLVSMSLGYNVKNRVILGYSYQTPIGSSVSAIGSAHEITLRFNFNKQFYDQQQPKRDVQTISPAKKGN